MMKTRIGITGSRFSVKIIEYLTFRGMISLSTGISYICTKSRIKRISDKFPSN